MTNCTKCPVNYIGDGPVLFLAGGISGCPDWQAEAVRALADSRWDLLNPRRDDFDFDADGIGLEQITWEHRYLNMATAILFWFPAETVCPITLFELGAWSRSSKLLFVGTHPDYARRFDVVTQLALARPDIRVYDSLDNVIGDAAAHITEPPT